MAEKQTSVISVSRKAFIQAVLVIFVLIVVAGVLTLVVPAGRYDRIEQDRRQVIDATSFRYVERPNYPAWRWFTAPVEVLFAEGNITVIAIILFILLVGMAFAVMDASGILKMAVATIIKASGGRKDLLLLGITFCFTTLGAFFGINEEVIPLLPIMIALAYSLGWDSLTGMGMSVLAANVGFSMAIFNPFTIGVSQRLAGLPLFSGAGLRLIWFFIAYAILAAFLRWHTHRITLRPEASLVYVEDQAERQRYGSFTLDEQRLQDPLWPRARMFLSVFFIFILAVLVASPFMPALSDLALPLTGLLFIIGGIGSALLFGAGRSAWRAAWQGFLRIAPAIPLMLMAVSVKHIVATGGILDTILHWASTIFVSTRPLTAALLIYGFTLLLELFIASGSAKALLVIPILMPLADLVGVTRQVAVSAFVFGDGFSNMVYPTNAALLIALSLTVIPYTKWLRWLLRLWFWIILATIAFLAVAVAIHYGPF